MEILVFGLISGSIILFGAVGFSMTLKAEGFINVAHGQMLLVGAYLALMFNNMGLSMLFAAILSMLGCGLLGVLLFRVLYHPVKRHGILVLLFTSVGTAFLLYGLVGALAGKRMMSFELAPVRAIRVFDRPLVTIYELMIIIFALLAALFVHLFLTKTWIGKSIRAVSDNYDLARVRGFDPVRTSDYVWFVASALAGVAGIFSAIIGSLHLQMGWQQIIIILSATVLGGLGSIYGVMLAAMLLGIGMELAITVIPSNYRTAVAFLIIIVILLVRPEGLQSLWAPRDSRRV